MRLSRYQTKAGVVPLSVYLTGLRDKRAAARIAMRLDRLEMGNFGDCRQVAGGVWELRVHYGPGYRIYYGRVGQELVVLLCAGDKQSQQRDIERAADYLADYLRRSGS